MPISPPKYAVKLLEATLSKPLKDPVLGDLEEMFFKKAEEKSLLEARRWYWRQAIISSVYFVRIKDNNVSKRSKKSLWICLSLTITMTLFYVNMEPYQKQRLSHEVSRLLNS